jgi:hypothetical protein
LRSLHEVRTPQATSARQCSRTITLPRLPDFAEPRNLGPASYSFLQVHGIRSDLQQAASERDGDCMGAIISLQFIH